METITIAKIYDRLCAILTNYENPGDDNGYTEDDKDILMYEDLVQLVNDISMSPRE